MTISELIDSNLKNLDDKCYFCFCQLNNSNSSKEHVIPKWLFKKFNHNDDGMKLGNHTNLRYKQLTIPACKKCNNIILSELEQDFIHLLQNEFSSLSIEDELIIVQWTLKVMLGTILKETQLDKDIKNKGEKILEYKQIQELIPLFILLHTIFYETKILNNKPWSFFITTFSTDNYDYHSNSFLKTASFKFGKIGFLITFDDSSYYEKAINKTQVLQNLTNKEFSDLSFKFFALREIETKLLSSRKELISDKLIITSKKHYHKPKVNYNSDYKKVFNYLLRLHKQRFS